MKLKDKVVFITDADCDCGKTIAERFGREGANLVLNSVPSSGKSWGTTDRLAGLSCKTMMSHSDLCSSGDVESLIQDVIARFGKIDVLIHTDNEVRICTIEECGEETYNHMMDRNVKSAFICTQSIGRRMMENRSGRIIYVSSIHDEKPTGCSFAYSAAKGALKMLCREAALELGEYGIRVNLIEAGAMEGDDRVFNNSLSSIYKDYKRKVPGKIPGTDEDLANLVLFLASDECGHLNGADIRMDGGFVLHYMDKLPDEETPEV